MDSAEIYNDTIFFPKKCPICGSNDLFLLKPIIAIKYALLNFGRRNFILGIPICSECHDKERKMLFYTVLPSLVVSAIIGLLLSFGLDNLLKDIKNLNWLSGLNTIPIFSIVLVIFAYFFLTRYHSASLSYWLRIYPIFDNKKMGIKLISRNESYFNLFLAINEDYQQWKETTRQNKSKSPLNLIKKTLSSIGMFLKATPLAYQYWCPKHNVQQNVETFNQCPICKNNDGISFVVAETRIKEIFTSI